MRKKQFPFYGVFVLCTTLLCSAQVAQSKQADTSNVNIHLEQAETSKANIHLKQADTSETIINLQTDEIRQRADSSKSAQNKQETESIQRADSAKTIFSNLEEIILSASFIRERQSPLRLSTVDRSAIEKKGIGQTYPEIIKNIPGIYATSESGSYGDAKINIRGFKQENISVLLNGIPISGLVTGNMFWNNWLGLTDATHSIQVQKGIGASMLSDNSVGGTINIITKTTEKEAAASAGYYITDYGQMKSFVALNSGELKGGWSLSAMASYAWGKSYADATDVNSWAYMFNAGKRINNHHSLLFTALGSPERHQQRSARLSATEVETYGRTYNKNWGYLNGEARNLSENFYHKPYLTLHHFYNSGKAIEISNAIYLSTGHGGGRWSESKGKRILDYRRDGLIDWDSVVADNLSTAGTIPSGPGYEGAAENSARNIQSDYLAGHTQTGFKSNISYKISPELTLQGGVHYQYYSTWEKEIITDLLGGNYWYEDYANNSLAGEAGRNPIKVEGDYIRTDNGKTINHLTLYSTINYKTPNWDIRAGVSGMGSANQRWDRYNYIIDPKSDIASAAGYSIKGGALRKITPGLSAYLNAALYSRVPYNDLFFAAGNNNITDDIKNEKNLLTEAGFRFLFQRGSVEVTGYYAKWKNKSIMSNPYKQPDNTNLRYLIRGLDAVHYGTEIEATFRPSRILQLDAFASFGNWRWKNDVSANIYDDYSGLVKDVVNVYSNGLPVGDSPQTQLALTASVKIYKGLEVNADWRFNSRMYADFDPKERQNPNDRASSYRIPDYHLFNMGAIWNLKTFKYRTAIYFNLNNIFDTLYIERGRDGFDHSATSFRGFWGFGRNFSAGVRFEL